jgi:PAS domain S-box-containing protein
MPKTGCSSGPADSESRPLAWAEEIEKVMDVVPAVILIARDPSCRQIIGNRTAAELYGTGGKINFSLTPAAGEARGPHRYFLGGNELLGDQLPMQRAVREDREIRDLEVDVLRPDGSRLTLLGNATPLHDARGRVQGCIASFVDITARKKAEEALRELSQAVEQSPVNVIITDLDGKIEYVNRRFTQRTGYTPAEVIGKNPRILKSGHTSDEEYRALWRTIVAGGQWSGEFLNKAKDGTLFWERAVITSIKDAAGRIARFFSVKEDITEQKKGEEALQQLERQLTHVARLSTLGEMAAELAHELNHPLYAILNYAKASRNLLAEEGPPDLDSLREWNEEIAEIASSAAEVVKRLRSFAQRGHSPRAICRIEEIVQEALDLLAVEMRRNRVRVETSFAPAAPPVRVDRVLIQQTIVNLLGNAVEAMQSTPLHARQIAIRTALGDEAVEVVISDRGPGLPPGSEPRIFEPFVSTKPNGLGMGLSIARTIVEAHGGQLSARSNAEGGASFRFTLPCRDGDHRHGD